MTFTMFVCLTLTFTMFDCFTLVCLTLTFTMFDCFTHLHFWLFDTDIDFDTDFVHLFYNETDDVCLFYT